MDFLLSVCRSVMNAVRRRRMQFRGLLAAENEPGTETAAVELREIEDCGHAVQISKLREQVEELQAEVKWLREENRRLQNLQQKDHGHTFTRLVGLEISIPGVRNLDGFKSVSSLQSFSGSVHGEGKSDLDSQSSQNGDSPVEESCHSDNIDMTGKPSLVETISQEELESQHSEPEENDFHSTQEVEIRWDACEASEVRVAGSFNNWQPSLLLTKCQNERHEGSLCLEPGVYTFKYVVDGHWFHDMRAETHMDDDGNVNNVLRVEGCSS